MTTGSEEERGSCEAFREVVFHFQAEELSAKERARFETHLDGCGSCARYLEVEAGFATLLRSGLQRVPAPESLRDRVGRSIDHEGRAPSLLVPRRRHFERALLAVAAIAALALLAQPLFRSPGGTAGPLDEGRHVVRTATVVDEDCDRAGRTVEQQRKCRSRAHFNALRMTDGTYWTIGLDGLDAKRLAADEAMRGRRVFVEGDLYEPIRTLHLTRWRETSGGTL